MIKRIEVVFMEDKEEVVVTHEEVDLSGIMVAGLGANSVGSLVMWFDNVAIYSTRIFNLQTPKE